MWLLHSPSECTGDSFAPLLSGQGTYHEPSEEAVASLSHSPVLARSISYGVSNHIRT